MDYFAFYTDSIIIIIIETAELRRCNRLLVTHYYSVVKLISNELVLIAIHLYSV